MKSVKRGRGPSMMDGVMSLVMGVFGLIWTVLASSLGGGLFALFGVVFIVIAIAQAVYSFSNATRKERFSEFDVTTGDEEPDPLNERFGGETREASSGGKADGDAFCPYCGARVQRTFAYCNQCGRKLPQAEP